MSPKVESQYRMMDLNEILSNRENGYIEYKRIAIPAVAKEVAAFASSRGDVVVIGVADADRTIVGLKEPFDIAQEKIQNWIHEYVRPAPSYSTGRVEQDGHVLLFVAVDPGLEPAYSFKEDFYYRNNEQSQRMPASEITRRLFNDRVTRDLKKLAEAVDHSHPNKNVSAGISGQGELATLNYKNLLDRLVDDLKRHFVSR